MIGLVHFNLHNLRKKLLKNTLSTALNGHNLKTIKIILLRKSISLSLLGKIETGVTVWSYKSLRKIYFSEKKYGTTNGNG